MDYAALRRRARLVGRSSVVPVAIGLSLTVGVLTANAISPIGHQTASVLQPAGVQEPVSLSSWMEQMQSTIGNRPLNEIVMPGSHDAGTEGITKDSGICEWGDSASTAKINPAIAASMSKSQSGTLAQQLDMGSRYLDLRLCEQAGKWYLYHGGPMGQQFFDTFDGRGGIVKGEADELADWINSHPKEVVILRLQTAAPPATAKDDTRAAISQLGGMIGGGPLDNPAIADRSLSPTSTYGQFMSKGKHIVFIDDTNSTTYPWAWDSSAQSFRGSYVEVSHNWQDILKALFTNQAQDNRDAVIARASKVFGTAPGADADKFFVLQGIVDPTNSIPAAAMSWLAGEMKLLPPSEADNMLLSLEHKLNKQLLDTLRGTWNTSNVTDNMNIIMTDDVNQNSDGVASGELQQEIISKNLPQQITANTFYDSGRSADGSWSAPDALAGAGDAFRYVGSHPSVAAMPDGSTQVVGIGLDGNVWHNIRGADGTWQGWRVLPAADNKTLGFKATDVAITGMPNGDAQVVAIGENGYAYHDIRHADASWQGWWSMPGTDNGMIKAAKVALAGMPDGSTQVLIFGADGMMRLGTRAQSGFWSAWSIVLGVHTANFQGKALSVAAMPNGDAQIAAVGRDGNVWYNIHRADGTWEGWGAPEGVSTVTMGASDVAITGLPDGSSQILAVGLDGNAYHTVRHADGIWNYFAAIPGIRGDFVASQVSIAGMPNGSSRTLLTTG